MDINILANHFYLAQLNDQFGQVTQAVFPSVSNLITAIIILIIGIILAVELARITKGLAKRLGLDEIFERAGVKQFIGRKDAKFLLSGVLAWAVKWFVLLFFITLAVDALKLPEVTQFLVQILNYLPNLVAAVAILTLGLIIGEMIYEAMKGVGEASGIELYRLAGIGAKYLVIVITILIILEQVGIRTTIIYIFAAGIALMIGLAGGLAFGLGGQTQAKELLEEMRKRMGKQ